MAEHYDIVLSDARGDDEPFVERLYHNLTSQGFKVWWDRECMPTGPSSSSKKFTRRF
jgi:hypothetical protein